MRRMRIASASLQARGGCRDMPNNCVGEQNSNFLLRKTKTLGNFCSPIQVFDVP